jgi:hypothetical protein
VWVPAVLALVEEAFERSLADEAAGGAEPSGGAPAEA